MMPSPDPQRKVSDGEASEFGSILATHMSNLQAALMAEHQKELEALRAENKLLQDKLLALESSQPNAATVVCLDNASQATKSVPETPKKGGSETPNGSAPANANGTALNGSASPPVTADAPEGSPSSSDIGSNRKASMAKKRQHSQIILTPDSGFIQRIVMSQKFEIASGCVILANTMMMALRLQYDSIDIGFDIGAGNFARTAADTWKHAEDVFYVIEIGFTAVFIIEFLFRCAALKLHSLRSGWMWFDGVVISVGAIDTFGSAALPVNPGMLRVLRLVRLVRLFKILKTMQAFDSLFLLQKAIVASMNAAIWSFAILVSVQVITGLFLNQLMQTFLLEEGHPIEAKRAVYKYYGTFSGTMLTMFEVTMASWVPACRVLVENVNESFIVFFIIYRCFFCFAVLKVIAAVFITETNRVLQHDDELTLMKMHRERAMFDKKVRGILTAISGDSLGWKELQDLAYDPEVVQHLSTLGFSPKDLEKLFWLIDNGSGRVDIEMFLGKIKQMQGPAKSIDILTVLKLVQKIHNVEMISFEKQGLITTDSAEASIEQEICDTLGGGRR